MAKISPRSRRLRQCKVKPGTKPGTNMLLSNSLINQLEPTDKRQRYYDSKVTGLVLEINTNGTKIFRFRKWIDGKEHQSTLGHYPALSIDDARSAAMKKFLEVSDKNNPTTTNDFKLIDLINMYFDQYAVTHCVTHKAMRKDFDRYWEHLYKCKVSQIGTQDIQDGMNAIAKRGKYRTANIALTLMKSVFNWAIKRKLINTTPILGIDKFKERSRERFLEPAEVQPLLIAINNYPDSRIRDFFLICLYTGARSGNVKSMRWADLDLKVGKWVIPRTKAGNSQTVLLSEEAIKVLTERLGKKELNPWVFPGGQRRVNTSHLKEPKRAWALICTQAGIQNLRIHDLRRSLAAYMVANKENTATIMKQLGHSSLAAAQVYQRLDLSAAKLATDRAINAMLQNPDRDHAGRNAVQK